MVMSDAPECSAEAPLKALKRESEGPEQLLPPKFVPESQVFTDRTRRIFRAGPLRVCQSDFGTFLELVQTGR